MNKEAIGKLNRVEEREFDANRLDEKRQESKSGSRKVPTKRNDKLKDLSAYEKCQIGVRDFLRDESGFGVVEIALILVVIIALVAIFRSKITEMLNDIFRRIFEQAGVGGVESGQ